MKCNLLIHPIYCFLIAILHTGYILFVDLFITFIIFENTKYFLSPGHKIKKPCIIRAGTILFILQVALKPHSIPKGHQRRGVWGLSDCPGGWGGRVSCIGWGWGSSRGTVTGGGCQTCNVWDVPRWRLQGALCTGEMQLLLQQHSSGAHGPRLRSGVQERQITSLYDLATYWPVPSPHLTPSDSHELNICPPQWSGTYLVLSSLHGGSLWAPDEVGVRHSKVLEQSRNWNKAPRQQGVRVNSATSECHHPCLTSSCFPTNTAMQLPGREVWSITVSAQWPPQLRVCGAHCITRLPWDWNRLAELPL